MGTTRNTLLGTALAACAVAAQSAAPTFDLTGAVGVEYTGTAPMTQNADMTVYWFLEQENVSYMTLGGTVQVDSWMLFYNPTEGRQTVSGSITFGKPIVEFFGSQAGLQSSASFGKVGTTYDYGAQFVGLEQRDETSFIDGTITIGKWAAGEPGDYVRVLTVTAVPEPASYALMGLGLAALVAAARRRAKA